MNLEELVDRFYVDVSRADGHHVNGEAEVIREGRDIVALLVLTSGRSPNITTPVLVPWHAVTAVSVIEEKLHYD